MIYPDIGDYAIDKVDIARVCPPNIWSTINVDTTVETGWGI